MLEEIIQCIRDLNRFGHSPATSTNYSFRDDNGKIWITRSGIDKSLIQTSDFIEIDAHGRTVPPFEHFIPSAETGIHCALYEWFPESNVVLHSHSIWPLLLSHGKSSICFEGYELQKAIPGIDTHECSVCIPVIANSQNMEEIRSSLQAISSSLKYHIFMIDKHGFYVWGSSLFEVKKYLDAFTYLCECEWHLKN